MTTVSSSSDRRTPANKGLRYAPQPLTPEEVRSLLRACSNRAPTGVRNRALLTVLYRAGLRVSEALAIRPRDIDAAQGTIAIQHGKGDKSRVVGLDPESFSVIERWMDRRKKLGINGHSTVFCTLKGGQLKSAYIRALLPRLAKKAKIEKRVHAHGLRHTHAAELARERMPMNLIQAQLGHANVSTTDRYIRHIAPQELIDRMRARAWTS